MNHNIPLREIVRALKEKERRETISDVIEALRAKLYETSDMDDINAIVRSVETGKTNNKFEKPDAPKDGYLWDSPEGLALYDQGRWILVSNGKPVSR